MRRLLFFIAVIVGLGSGAAHAGAIDFRIVSQSVAVNQAQKSATFEVQFSRVPDFSEQDNSARQADAFQYEIDGNWNGVKTAPISFNDIDAVVRGAEIWEGNGLPIRSRDGNGGVFAGGWGPVREFVPFTLSSDTLTFTTSLSTIGNTNGHFRYRVFASSNGQLTNESVGAVIPLPPAIAGGMVLLGGIAVFRTLRARRRLAR